jgi:hypothetical protein
MDIGLFAYWWTGVAGEFSARTISETGADRPFFIVLFVLFVSWGIVLFAVFKLRRIHPSATLQH